MKAMKPLILMMMILLMISSVTYATTTSEVASQLICTCGCNMIVSDCNCGTAGDMRALIQSQIDKGMDKRSIMNDFVSQYGEKVLAAPTKSGFNLTAWTTPFIVLLIAIGVVIYVIRAWTHANHESGTLATSDLPQQNSADRERLKRELAGFDA